MEREETPFSPKGVSSRPFLCSLTTIAGKGLALPVFLSQQIGNGGELRDGEAFAADSGIGGNRADGGGDTPEAVAEILDEVITQGSWSADTNKIAFLIFDAPPHDGKEKMFHVGKTFRMIGSLTQKNKKPTQEFNSYSEEMQAVFEKKDSRT